MYMTEKKDTITINEEEYYPIPVAARLTHMTDWGLRQKLTRLNIQTRKLPGSPRQYVKKSNIDFLLGKG